MTDDDSSDRSLATLLAPLRALRAVDAKINGWASRISGWAGVFVGAFGVLLADLLVEEFALPDLAGPLLILAFVYGGLGLAAAFEDRYGPLDRCVRAPR